VGEMLDQGLKVGLGTDVSGAQSHNFWGQFLFKVKVLGGFALSILATIRDASIVSKVLAMRPNAPLTEADLIEEARQSRPTAVSQSIPARDRDITPTRPNLHLDITTTKKFADTHLHLDTLFFLATLGGAQGKSRST